MSTFKYIIVDNKFENGEGVYHFFPLGTWVTIRGLSWSGLKAANEVGELQSLKPRHVSSLNIYKTASGRNVFL